MYRFNQLTFAICLTVWSMDVRGDVHWSTRNSNYDITFDDLTFTDAVAAYEVVVEAYADVVGDTREAAAGVKSGWQNFEYSSTGGLTFTVECWVLRCDPKNNTLWVGLYEFLDELNLSGTSYFSYETSAIVDPQPSDVSWITATVRDGHYVLDFSGGGAGFVDAGGTFYLHLVLPGEWTLDSTDTGGVTRSINAEFTITSDFVYDPVADATVFEAEAIETPEWNAQAMLTFTLYGDPAPILCEGDANGDGTVDPLDSGYVLARLGCPVGTGDAACDTADQNGDGTVDPLDVGYVLARFGECM